MQNVKAVFVRDAEGFMCTFNVNKVFTTCGDGHWSDVAKDVFVTEIAMYVSTVNEGEDGEEEYYDGDLAVIYDTNTLDNSTDGLIYTDSAFLQQVREALVAAGVSTEAAYDVNYSEQGMQDKGRVSLDAYALAEELRANFVTA